MPTSDDSLPPGWLTLRPAFEALATTLRDRRVRYAIMGGLAMSQHARPRATDDIDALVIVPQMAMPGLFETLGERGFKVEVVRNIKELREGFTTIRFRDVIVDLMGPLIPAYTHAMDRAIEAELFGQSVSVLSAEGLVVTKLIAWRPQDQTDIRDVLTAYGPDLDYGFIRAELATFAKADDPRWEKFEAWVREVSGT